MAFTFTCRSRCSKCGAEHFISSYHPSEFAPVTCVSCGEVTTVKIAVNTLDPAEAMAKAAIDTKQEP
jgi:hypothetical protein